jgi:methyltransferase (TIGR00027 family)
LFVTDGGKRPFALATSVDPTFVDYNLARYVMSTRALADAGSRGAQIVVLGVGSDCRVLSMPELAGATIYLLDQTEVLALRRNVLADHGVVEPSNVTSLALDLGRDAVPEVLRQNGFRPELPTLLLAEGVLFYLPEAKTLELIDPAWLGDDCQLWCDLWTRPRVDALNAAVEPRLGTKLFHAMGVDAVRKLGWETLAVTPLEQVVVTLGHRQPDLAAESWLLVQARTH